MAVHMRPKDGRQLACYHSTLETSPIIGVMGIGESQYTYFKKKKNVLSLQTFSPEVWKLRKV